MINPISFLPTKLCVGLSLTASRILPTHTASTIVSIHQVLFLVFVFKLLILSRRVYGLALWTHLSFSLFTFRFVPKSLGISNLVTYSPFWREPFRSWTLQYELMCGRNFASTFALATSQLTEMPSDFLSRIKALIRANPIGYILSHVYGVLKYRLSNFLGNLRRSYETSGSLGILS